MQGRILRWAPGALLLCSLVVFYGISIHHDRQLSECMAIVSSALERETPSETQLRESLREAELQIALLTRRLEGRGDTSLPTDASGGAVVEPVGEAAVPAETSTSQNEGGARANTEQEAKVQEEEKNVKAEEEKAAKAKAEEARLQQEKAKAEEEAKKNGKDEKASTAEKADRATTGNENNPIASCPSCTIEGSDVVCSGTSGANNGSVEDAVWTSSGWCRQPTERMTLRDNVVETQLSSLHNFGNAISPYWQGLAMAALGNYGFRVNNSEEVLSKGGWLKHLPMSLSPLSPATRRSLGLPPFTETQFLAACDGCSHGVGEIILPHLSWIWAHRCEDSWVHIRPLIQTISQFALKQFHVGEVPRPSDLVVYERCSWETVASHQEHGPAAHSFYDRIRESGELDVSLIERVVFVGLTIEAHCKENRKASRHAVRHRLRIPEHIPITDFSKSAVDDWAYVANAHHVIIPWVGSSFGLWASLASCGKVWAPGFKMWSKRQVTADPGYVFFNSSYLDHRGHDQHNTTEWLQWLDEH